jgi:RNA polymerase sigma-70 factor (ECF subfamily)
MRKAERKSIIARSFFRRLKPSEDVVWWGMRCIIRSRRKFSIISAGTMSDTHEVTLLLAEWAKGNQQALDDLTPLVYRELRQLAASYLRKERQGHTLQPTALVHEAYVRLVDQTNPTWQSRSHFFGVAARLMRQILVDHARRKQAGKRAGIKVPLDEAVSFQPERGRDLVALDSGLSALEKLDPRKCKAVELRYFGGLSMEEIALTLEVSTITVRRDLRMAEAWLHQEMQDS